MVVDSLKKYKERYDAIVASDYASWKRAYGGTRCCHCGQSLPPEHPEQIAAEEAHNLNFKLCNAQKHILFDEMLADPAVKHLVCTHTIQFMGDLAEGEDGRFISNHVIDARIKAKFPTVCADSESGQGFCYAPESLAQEVMDFIKPWVLAKSVKVRPTDKEFWTVNWQVS